MARTYQSFDFVATVVEEQTGEVVEAIALDIQWFSKTIFQIFIVCATACVATAVQKGVNYFQRYDLPETDSRTARSLTGSNLLADDTGAVVLRDPLPLHNTVLSLKDAPAKKTVVGFSPQPTGYLVEWATQDLVALHTANYDDAKSMSFMLKTPSDNGIAWA